MRRTKCIQILPVILDEPSWSFELAEIHDRVAEEGRRYDRGVLASGPNQNWMRRVFTAADDAKKRVQNGNLIR